MVIKEEKRMEEDTGARSIKIPWLSASSLALWMRVWRSVSGFQEPRYKKGTPFSIMWITSWWSASVWARYWWVRAPEAMNRELREFQMTWNCSS